MKASKLLQLLVLLFGVLFMISCDSGSSSVTDLTEWQREQCDIMIMTSYDSITPPRDCYDRTPY